MKSKGLWIPIEILSRRDLRLHDKVVLALVRNLNDYGGIVEDYMDDWAATLGCDTEWLMSVLRRLQSLRLIHYQDRSWRIGASDYDPLSYLPDLPDGVTPDYVTGDIAWVSTPDGLKRYRNRMCNNNNMEHPWQESNTAT